MRRSRKRLRKPHMHKKAIAKQNVEKGRERITKSGRKIAGKTFQSQAICICSRECPIKILVDVIRQKEIFDAYYNDASWSQKTLLIQSSVKTKNVQRKRSDIFPIMPMKKRNVTCEYNLLDSAGNVQQVCRNFFMNCLQVSMTRIHSALNMAKTNPSARENRGRTAPANKTTEDMKSTVIKFIESIPAYQSHYGRAKSQKKYLHHNLNIVKLYREYKRVMEFRQQNSVSEYVFRGIFNTEFNLSFKRRHSDTCKTCDGFQTSLSSSIVPFDVKDSFVKQRDIHMKLVESTNANFRKDVIDAIGSMAKTVVLTFDLQKTLETPSITTSIAFYRRQLWTYNFCIYDEVNKRG